MIHWIKIRLRAGRIQQCRRSRLRFEQGFKDGLEFKKENKHYSYTVTGPTLYDLGFMSALQSG